MEKKSGQEERKADFFFRVFVWVCSLRPSEQDVLSLDNSARMNLPGTAEGNWAWRMRGDPDALWGGLELTRASDKLRSLAERYDR